MKKYLDMIIKSGKKEDMDCLGDILVELMYELKESNPKEYKHKIVGMAYNYTIDDDLAHEIVEDMRPKGEYWSKETVESVVGNVSNLNEIYVVMNSLVNDYADIISPDDVDTYVKMTNAWLNDVDAKPNKVWHYFVN
jgi:Glu-tRNA(Gln) amidotransferase subunit E-like FAD-binding protein